MSIIRKICALACAAALAAIPTVDARDWKQTPSSLAQNYGMINDSRPDNRMVMIVWFPPAMFPEGNADSKTIRDILDRYIVLGVLDAQIQNEGTFTYRPIETLQANDKSGKPLKLLDAASQPPLVASIVTVVQSMMRQALGAVGQNLHWYVFDAGSQRACAVGGFSIPLAGEIYTYDTPIPGCPKS